MPGGHGYDGGHTHVYRPDAYEGAYSNAVNAGDACRPPLPYTHSELELEDHPTTRTPDYYAAELPRRLSSEDEFHNGPSTTNTFNQSANHDGSASASPSGPSSVRPEPANGVSSSERRGRTWEDRRARARERQERGRRARAAASPASGAAEERNLCCSVIGPWRPFWGRQSLTDVATSHVLPPRAFLVWRLAVFGAGVAALTLTALRDRYSLRGTQLVALAFGVYLPLRLAFVTYQYLRVKGDGDEVILHGRTTSHALIVLLYQANLVLQIFSPLGLWFTLRSEPERLDINGLVYSGRPDIFIPVATLLILSVIDMFFSALDFRLTYVLPTVLYGALFMVLTLFRFGVFRRGVYTGMCVAALVVIALVVLVIGRSLNIMVRRHSSMVHQDSQLHSIGTLPSRETEDVEVDDDGSYDLEGGRRGSAF